MPRYDYQCKQCYKELEINHKIDEHPGLCSCGGSLTKVFRPVSISFRGKGFYTTDK